MFLTLYFWFALINMLCLYGSRGGECFRQGEVVGKKKKKKKKKLLLLSEHINKRMKRVLNNITSF